MDKARGLIGREFRFVRLWQRRLLVMLGFWLATTHATAVAAALPTLSPQPQAYGNTCQSYSLAYALAATGLSGADISTYAALRNEELALRSVIGQIATARRLSPYHHKVWVEAVSQHTGGRAEQVVEYMADRVEFMKRLRELSNTWDARQALAASWFGIARPVMTSVTRVGNTPYSSGHILTILGVDSRPLSPEAMAVLNSAVMAKNTTKRTCEPEDLPGDLRYSATAAVITDYELKSFSGRYLFMYIRLK